MTEREKWEAGLWYDANFDEELRIEREKAEELYTEFNQTRPSQKEKRAELLHKLLPGMAEDVVILPHFYTDYGYNCVIGAGSYLNHGAYLMDCAKITIGQHCFIGPGSIPSCRRSATAGWSGASPSRWAITSGWVAM